MARYNLNVRVAALGIKHVDIIRTLNEQGFKVRPDEYYQFKNGKDSPKSEIILREADRILEEMEAKKHVNDNAGRNRGKD